MTCTQCKDHCPAPQPQQGREWTFVVPKKLLSANAGVVNRGPTRWRYAKERKEWEQWLMFSARFIPRASKPPSEVFDERRHVTITRLYSGREREMDERNIDTKALVDSMVRAGLLVDDSPRWLTLKVDQERSKDGVTGVRIVIRESV